MLAYRRLTLLALPIALAAVVLLTGCSDSDSTRPQDPGNTDDATTSFDGTIDRNSATFVLQIADSTDPGNPRPRLELIGGPVTSDPAEQALSLDVAIRNLSDEPMSGTMVLWLGRFRPESVTPLNADQTLEGRRYGYDYGASLGDDAVLSPGETSTGKRWTFRDPDIAPFTFAVRLEAALPPPAAHIAGIAFVDQDENGRLDRGEHGIPGGVALTLPDGSRREAGVDRSGRYAFRVEAPGLYTVAYGTPFGAPMECFTTPNPLQIILVAGEDGRVRSIDDADFGVKPGPCSDEEVPSDSMLVEMTDLRPGQIHQDPYRLIEAHLRGDVLVMRVGFGGCGPDHPFKLYISKAFMESNPVQTWAILSHDDLGEQCDAAFERVLRFDLRPLRRAYVAAYGQPGQVAINLRDHQGNAQRILFGP